MQDKLVTAHKEAFCNYLRKGVEGNLYQMTEVEAIKKSIHKAMPMADVMAERLAIAAMQGSKEFRSNRWIDMRLLYLEDREDSYVLSCESVRAIVRKEDANHLPDGRWLIKYSALVKSNLIAEVNHDEIEEYLKSQFAIYKNKNDI